MRSITNGQGQATVEFAIVAPLLFFLLYAIIGVGGLIFDYSAANELAWEMARTLAVQNNAAIAGINTRLGEMHNVRVQVDVRSADGKVRDNILAMLAGVTNVSEKITNVDSEDNGDVRINITVTPQVTLPGFSQVAANGVSSGTVGMRLEN